MTLATAMLCMALNVYHEGRGETLQGQRAIAHVTWNRAEHSKSNVCSVVTEPNQFSWTESKIKRKRNQYVLNESGKPTDEKAWFIAQQIAIQTINGSSQDVTHGATFYHENRSKPNWRKLFKLVAVIGRHKFYKVA